jgi:hypothetical protein
VSSGTPERRSSLFSGTPERRSSWWREPLPAWAQVAAAVLIFAAGLTAGALGGASGSETAAVAPASPMPAQAPEQVESRQSLAVPSAPAVSVADLARLEQRLRAIESAQTVNASVRTVSAASVADGGAQLTPAGVLALIDQRLGVSEDRLRNDIALVAGAASDIEAQVVALQQRLPRTGVVTYEQFVERNRERELLTTPVSFPGRPGR